MESVSSKILELYASGEAPLLVTLGIRPDLSIIVQRDKMHCAGLGPLSAPMIALALSYLTKATDANYADLRALTLQNDKNLEVTYLLLRNQVGSQFETVITNKNWLIWRAFITALITGLHAVRSTHPQNTNPRRRFLVGLQYKRQKWWVLRAIF
jgi:hypothetical protein